MAGAFVALFIVLANSRGASTDGSAVAQPSKQDATEAVAETPLSAPTNEIPGDRTAAELSTDEPEPEVKPEAAALPGQANEHTIRRLGAMRHSLDGMDKGLAGSALFDAASCAHAAVAMAMMIELDVAGEFEVRAPGAALNPHGRTPRPPGTHMLAGGGRTYIVKDVDYPEYIALGDLCNLRNEDAKSAPPTENELLYMRPVPADLIDAVRARCARAEALLGEAARKR